VIIALFLHSDHLRTLFQGIFSNEPERREKEYIYILLIILKSVEVCGMWKVPTFFAELVILLVL